MIKKKKLITWTLALMNLGQSVLEETYSNTEVQR